MFAGRDAATDASVIGVGNGGHLTLHFGEEALGRPLLEGGHVRGLAIFEAKAVEHDDDDEGCEEEIAAVHAVGGSFFSAMAICMYWSARA